MKDRSKMDDSVMRVTFVDHSSEKGGAELALVRLLRTNEDWLPALVVPAAPEAANDAFSNLPPSVAVLRSGPQHVARSVGGTGVWASVKLATKIVGSALSLLLTGAARDSDVIVANTTRAAVYVSIASIVARRPYVVHIRDMIDASGVGSTAAALMKRIVLPHASAVIANSHASLATVSAHLSPGCISAVIPSPAGLEPVDPATAGSTGKVRRIGMVARLDPWKGQDLLIRAFAHALPESSEELVLFGGASFGHEGYATELLATAAELGVADRVKIEGHTSDVVGAIAGLDVCIQCSIRAEPLGQNVLQYLAAGKPTIVANEGGPSEWVRDRWNGLTFQPRDVSSLAAAIRLLCEDGDLRNSLARAAAATDGLARDGDVASAVSQVLRSVARNG